VAVGAAIKLTASLASAISVPFWRTIDLLRPGT
jgi:hypothetical protein